MDLIPNSRLMEIARRAWFRLGGAERSSPQAIQIWRSAIYMACKPSLDTAAEGLRQRAGGDEDEQAFLASKLSLMRDAFIRQVDRVMRDLSEGDRVKRDQAKAMASVNAMIKDLERTAR